MYKDKGKQREAVKLATRRYRAKGITKVSHEQGITDGVSLNDVLPPVDVATMDISRHEPLPKLTTVTEQPMKTGRRTRIEPQSYNPMKVGYVPPKE